MRHYNLDKLFNSGILNHQEYEAGKTLLKLNRQAKKHVKSTHTIHNHRYERAFKLFQMILRHSHSRQVLLDLTKSIPPYRSYSELQLLKSSLGDIYDFLSKRKY